MHTRDVVEKLAADMGFSVSSADGALSLDLHGLPISAKMVEAGADKVFLILACRTLSWDWSGERTDLNDVVSHLTAAFLRAMNRLSARLILIPNPAVDIEPEIYARYLIFDQPHGSAYRLDDEGIDRLHRILTTLVALRSYLPHPHQVDDEAQSVDSYGCLWKPPKPHSHPYIRYDSSQAWPLQVTHAIGNQFVVGDAIANLRHDPDWLYFRTEPGTLSIVQSETLAGLFRTLANREEGHRLAVPAIAGNLYLAGDLRNYISNRLLTKLRSIFRRLEGPQGKAAFRIIPLENSLICVGGRHSLFISTQSGRLAFEQERARLEKRHDAEARILFPIPGLEWADEIPDHRFELLIRELLAIEPAVTWVRSVGHTNDRDQGRDLLAEWLLPEIDPEKISEEKPPVRLGRVVVQCKAFARSVGKRDVQDVYDTIRFHQADGYFLAVATRVTAPLATFLDNLRREGEVFIDWWGRQEIEDRLRRAPAILAKFPDLVQSSHSTTP